MPQLILAQFPPTKTGLIISRQVKSRAAGLTALEAELGPLTPTTVAEMAGVSDRRGRRFMTAYGQAEAVTLVAWLAANLG